MEKTEFYKVFKEIAEKVTIPGNENLKECILKICEKQPELLIMPGFDKQYYGVAAELVFELGYEKLMGHIDEVFVWLQDRNWPGADRIAEFLATIPNDDLVIYIQNALRTAYKDNDDMWVAGISYVIKLAKLSEYFWGKGEFRKILEYAECTEYTDEYSDDTLEIVDFDSGFLINLRKCEVTEFDLHFCLPQEIVDLINCVARWSLAQSEDDKQKYQNEIITIREGYRARLNK